MKNNSGNHSSKSFIFSKS